MFKEIKNFNVTLVKRLISDCKNINIYSPEIPSSYVLKQLKLINKSEGTSIDIIKKDKKSLKDYNFIYFADDIKQNYPKLRIDKNSLVIDQNMAMKDKFNTNNIFIENVLKNMSYNIQEIKFLVESYGKLEVATMMRKVLTNY